MLHSQLFYNQIREIIANNDWTPIKEKEYQQILQQTALIKPTKATLITAYQHVWEYFKKIATAEEKQQ
ncbi:DUF1722 domain-containing protein [Liquorilactobacillus oeni]|uniref:DUF1722 domain-containing protein n=1 Tax=Liquorilactobacillus oeni DSM 19972 TaxID=1423777 RepID=A0A0R1MAH3_9LACO|nr:DUF1722 domain-containing protein [Liquorilactobacillus oeni]KRL05084.1 hypothetical protein FD46_GL001028 [Liquorilactobacillus oeni DSM 19972]